MLKSLHLKKNLFVVIYFKNKNRCLVILLLLLTTISCNNEPSISDFNRTVSDFSEPGKEFDSEIVKSEVESSFQKNEKSFFISKIISDVLIEIKMIPNEVLALKELKQVSSFTKAEFDSVVDTYGDIVYLDLRFKSLTKDLYKTIHKKYAAEEVSVFMNDNFFSNILLDGKISPSVYHYNSTMGVFPGFSFLIGFDKELFHQANNIKITDCVLTSEVTLNLSTLNKK